jgi:phosphohistidine phosphatase SixA
MTKILKRFLLPALVSVAGFMPVARSLTAQAPVVVYLVRHAEKADDSRDPPLSAAGEARAGALAGLLKDAGVSRIWSTDFQRTRNTAKPVGAALGIAAEIYDGSKLADFAARLKGMPGRHLVVGHSNTTPELVRLLGGTAGPPIADTEYDRVYFVVLAGGQVVTTVLRY